MDAVQEPKRFDHVVTLADKTKQFATDISVTINSVADRERQKENKYKEDMMQDRWKNTHFVPLVITTSGDISEKFQDFLHSLIISRTHNNMVEWRFYGQTAAHHRKIRIDIAQSIAESQLDLFRQCAGKEKPAHFA